MTRKIAVSLLSLLVLTVAANQAWAAETDNQLSDSAFFFSVIAASCAFGMSIASAVCGIAQSKAIARAMDSIARQPAAYKDIQTLLIIGLALIESLALYTLVIALILIYAAPFSDVFMH